MGDLVAIIFVDLVAVIVLVAILVLFGLLLGLGCLYFAEHVSVAGH